MSIRRLEIAKNKQIKEPNYSFLISILGLSFLVTNTGIWDIIIYTGTRLTRDSEMFFEHDES